MLAINGKVCVANGRNLIVQSDLKPGYLDRGLGVANSDGGFDFKSNNYIATNGATAFTFSSPDYVFKGSDNDTLAMYDSDKNYLGWQSITSATQTLSKSNVAYIKFSINFINEGGTPGKLSDWLDTHRYKLETGTTATPLTPAPVDKVFSDGKQVYGRNLLTGTGHHTVTGTGAWTQGNLSNETIDDLLTLFKGLEGQTVTVSVDYEYSGFIAGSVLNRNRLGWETTIFSDITSRFSLWYSPNNDSGSGRMSVTFVVPENITGIDESMGYIQFSGSGTGILSHFKLEKGSVATPWSPAPEDVM